MRSIVGIPTAIFRDGDPFDLGRPQPYVKAMLTEGPEVTAYYSGEPPPPLVPCRMWTDGTEYWVHGPNADVRPVLREHFLTVPTATVDGVVACDTPWTLDINGANSQLVARASTGQGVARLVAGDADGRYCDIGKDGNAIFPSTADGFWVQSKFQIPSSVASVQARIGLFGPNGTPGAGFGMNASTSANWSMYVDDVTSSELVVTATVAAAAAFHWADIFYSPGVFAACWVDGSGPYVGTTSPPDLDDDIEPRIRVTSQTTVTKELYVDCFFCDAIDGPIRNPSTDPLLTGVR